MTTETHRAYAPSPMIVWPTIALSHLAEIIVDLFHGAGSSVGYLLDDYKLRARERRAMQELAALDDRTLFDIGVSRADIAEVARRAVRSKAS